MNSVSSGLIFIVVFILSQSDINFRVVRDDVATRSDREWPLAWQRRHVPGIDFNFGQQLDDELNEAALGHFLTENVWADVRPNVDGLLLVVDVGAESHFVFV